MSKLLFTLFISLFIISGFQNLSGQSATDQIDATAEFKWSLFLQASVR